MLLKYDPNAAVLKFSFQLEDVPVDQQYSNLVSSIKRLLADSTIPEVDKQSIVGIIRKKTGEPIDTLDDLISVLDHLEDQGAQLKQAYEIVQSDQSATNPGTFSTGDDTSQMLQAAEPVAEPFETDSNEL